MDQFDADAVDDEVANYDGQPIYRGPGAGSLTAEESWAKANSSRGSNDGRSTTQTTFYPEQADDESRSRHQLHREPSDRRSWGQLAKWNDGVGSTDRARKNFQADIKRWIETFCDTLELSDTITYQTKYVVADINTRRAGQFRMEDCIIAAISLVVDVYSDPDPDEWTVDDWLIYKDDFQSLMDDVEMDMSRLWSARSFVRDQSAFFDE